MKNYPSNLTDNQWKSIEMIFDPEKRKRKHPLIEIMNAILYSLVSGCQWRMLPKDFPPYNTVYYYFRKWKYEGTFELAMFELHQIVCVNILGLPLAIAIHAANIHDSVGAEMVFKVLLSDKTG